MQEGKHGVEGSATLFYMVHCGKALYNNLLWRNWSVGALSKMVIIGNSFRGTWERCGQPPGQGLGLPAAFSPPGLLHSWVSSPLTAISTFCCCSRGHQPPPTSSVPLLCPERVHGGVMSNIGVLFF